MLNSFLNDFFLLILNFASKNVNVTLFTNEFEMYVFLCLQSRCPEVSFGKIKNRVTGKEREKLSCVLLSVGWRERARTTSIAPKKLRMVQLFEQKRLLWPGEYRRTSRIFETETIHGDGGIHTRKTEETIRRFVSGPFARLVFLFPKNSYFAINLRRLFKFFYFFVQVTSNFSRENPTITTTKLWE